MKVVAVLCLLAAAAVQVYTFPGGAPSGACTNIFPVGHTNPANSIADPMGGPFQLDISNFTMCTGAGSAPGYCYYPGETYYREFMNCVDDTWVLQCCSFFMHEVCYLQVSAPRNFILVYSRTPDFKSLSVGIENHFRLFGKGKTIVLALPLAFG